MASKDGMVNLAVACEQERLLKWLLTAIDAGYLNVTEAAVLEGSGYVRKDTPGFGSS